MSFEGIFSRALSRTSFGADRYLHCYKERTHISKGAIDTYSKGTYLEVSKFYKGGFQSPAEVRYVVANNITYDMLMSIYDVNARSVFVCRLFGFEGNTSAQLSSYIESLGKLKRKPNLETRLIGLQSKQKADYLGQISDLISAAGIKLMEVDLFGKETRHIAIDMKLGVSQDVLLEDRLYRPGELINTITLEQFERSLKK